MKISRDTVFGLLKTTVDVHTMGISTISNILNECGFKVCVAPSDVMEAMNDPQKINNRSLITQWILNNNISSLGFSYRLDPIDAYNYFSYLYKILKDEKLLDEDGGNIKQISFSGLPDSCSLVKRKYNDSVILFSGGETPIESLKKYGVPDNLIPKSYTSLQPYDKSLIDFGKTFIESEQYKFVFPQDHYGYPECGTINDTFIKRLDYCRSRCSLPIIRLHAGPYSPDRKEAIKEFKSWCEDLAKSKLLDVLSIGSSQLTQSNFGENWNELGLHNGGGVPINSEQEYKEISLAARPMLVRTYSGTKNVPWLAEMHERTLNISWHALSFWWFCELDGRGKNTVFQNLREHIETIKYAARTGKPIEPNVPHHFAFRGSDDVSYIISGFLAAKTAKIYGIKHLILQNMLNTPKSTFGKQDLAKGRALLKLVRSLEDENFKVSLQTRAGLDYFVTDLEKAKIQLAAVTALMDDIEPCNPNSPEIIHVVSYSEAVRLATPEVMKESIKITLGALNAYRELKKRGKTWDTVHDEEIKDRYSQLYSEAIAGINLLEKNIPNLYSPEGLFKVFEEGFLPVPFILDEKRKFPKATMWNTAVIDGGVKVVDRDFKPIDTETRYKMILSNMCPSV